jgi:DNA-binding NarL/FixJ family response regulator
LREGLEVVLAADYAAAVLGITPRTVAYHKYGAMQALAIHSSAELVRFAVDAGWVAPLAGAA